jgi:phage tail tape-measure protein
MKREFYGIERMADDVFILLKKAIEDSVAVLDQAKNRRNLNEDEQSIHKKLQKKLDEAEEAIRKIKQAEKEIDE